MKFGILKPNPLTSDKIYYVNFSPFLFQPFLPSLTVM